MSYSNPSKNSRGGFTPTPNKIQGQISDVRDKVWGFTLIEMVVVVGIIALLTTMTLVYNRSGSQQLKLFKEEAVVVGILNQAKALTIEKFNKEPNTCAFGVHFEAGSQDFTLFQDLKPADNEFGCKNFNGPYKNDFHYNLNQNPSELIQIFSVEKEFIFEITSGVANTPISLGQSVDVLFVPPELTVTSTSPLPLSFKIVNPINRATVTITVNSTGQITAQ